MEKKVNFYAKIMILLFLLFYTEKINFGNVYQYGLFTTKNQIDRNNDKIAGFTFKFGGSTEEIETWERYRAGFPFKAITIDRLEKEKITQGRIEYEYIFLNLIFGAFYYCVFRFILLPIIKFLKSTLIDDPAI